ncbi:hypothetical protein [Dyella japonica]|uniref:hypothetical protein n=1 Tax=Dyella japonica TaxID=231455 RepID=UPI00058598C3|nr:hypothetical protein [Dyella japonica]
MKRFFWLFLLASTATQAQTGDLVVWPPPLKLEQRGADLLACLPSDAEPMPLDAAAVSQISGTWPPKEWAIVKSPKAQPVTLKAGDCVHYNRPLKGYRQIGGGQPLRPGETYGFLLQRVGDTGNSMTGRYVGVFCVEQLPGGERNFLPYIEHDDGTTTYPRCGTYIGSPPAADGINPPGRPSADPSAEH